MAEMGADVQPRGGGSITRLRRAAVGGVEEGQAGTEGWLAQQLRPYGHQAETIRIGPVEQY